MSTSETEAESDRLHAAKIGLLLVSLDEVAARAGQLGLGFDSPERVRDAARACSAWWRNPRGSTAGPYDAVVGAMVDALEMIGDRVDGPKVAAWLDRFTGADSAQPITDNWSALLSRFTPDYSRALQQLGLRAESAATVSRVATEHSARAERIDGIDESIQEALTTPWDRAQYAEYQEVSDLISPTDYLWGWLQMEAVLAALDTIIRRLSAEELRVFEAWAKAAAEAELRIPAPRVSLDGVRRLLDKYGALPTPAE